MTNNSSVSPQKKFHLDEEWGSHPAIEWLFANKNMVIYTFFGLMAALIFASQYVNWRTINAEKDYFEAQAAFNDFEKNSSQLEENSQADADLNRLLTLLQKHPELKPKYDGPVAQTLIIDGKAAQAQPIVASIFDRTQADHLHLYRDYTKASLLIAHGLHQEALQVSQQLDEKLNQANQEKNPFLFLFNLVRLGLLYQQTGQLGNELNIWDQLQSKLLDSEAGQITHQTLSIGQASLDQYITERRKRTKEE